MSPSAFHTVAFNEHGARIDEARLPCHPRLSGSDAVEVRDTTVRLYEDGNEAGRLEYGLLNWRCFRIYVSHIENGVMVLALHNDGRAMLAVSATCELGSDIASMGPSGTQLAGMFLYTAAKALNVETLATQMRSGMSP